MNIGGVVIYIYIYKTNTTVRPRGAKGGKGRHDERFIAQARK